jgi:hypothetical protein
MLSAAPLVATVTLPSGARLTAHQIIGSLRCRSCCVVVLSQMVNAETAVFDMTTILF